MNITINDIAKLCNCSRATVSRVLRNCKEVKPETRHKVLKVMEEHNYQPNQMARSLARGFSNIIALIMGDIASVSQMEIAKSIQRTLDAAGYMTMLFNTESDNSLCDKALDAVVSNKFAGAFVISTSGTTEKMHSFLQAKIPLVMVNRHEISMGVDSVMMDDCDAAFRAANRLIALGHRRIVLINGDRNSASAINADMGYRMALKGIRVNEDDIYNVNVVREMAFQTGLDIQKEKPDVTAVICLAQEQAIGFLDSCLANKKEIPKDYSVFSLELTARMFMGGFMFDTIGVAQELLGNTAVKKMLSRINEVWPNKAPDSPLEQYSRTVLMPIYYPGNSIGPLKEPSLD